MKTPKLYKKTQYTLNMKIWGSDTLDNLLDSFEPVEDSKNENGPLFELICEPTAEELLKYGKLEAGEISIEKDTKNRKIRARYGESDSVYGHREGVIHNHTGLPKFSSHRDVIIARNFGLTKEWIIADDGIAQVEYHFKRRRRGKIVLKDIFSSRTWTRDRTEAEEIQEDSYYRPTIIRHMPMPYDKNEGRRVGGSLSMIILPIEDLVTVYKEAGFWRTFDKRTNWEQFVFTQLSLSLQRRQQKHRRVQLKQSASYQHARDHHRREPQTASYTGIR
jgi:hypothetical protein